MQGVDDYSKSQVLKPGINAAYELSFSNMSMMFNLGANLGGIEKSKGTIYEKLGLRYYFAEKWFANMTIKAHYARADYIIFGIGYKLNLFYY